MSPTPELGTHAHSAAAGPEARTQHRKLGAGRPAIEAPQPQYPTAPWPGGMGKRDRP